MQNNESILARENMALRAENAALKADIRCMVKKAADNKLDGYRELGQRAANAENERDAASAQLEALRYACRFLIDEDYVGLPDKIASAQRRIRDILADQPSVQNDYMPQSVEKVDPARAESKLASLQEACRDLLLMYPWPHEPTWRMREAIKRVWEKLDHAPGDQFTDAHRLVSDHSEDPLDMVEEEENR